MEGIKGAKRELLLLIPCHQRRPQSVLPSFPSTLSEDNQAEVKDTTVEVRPEAEMKIPVMIGILILSLGLSVCDGQTLPTSYILRLGIRYKYKDISVGMIGQILTFANDILSREIGVNLQVGALTGTDWQPGYDLGDLEPRPRENYDMLITFMPADPGEDFHSTDIRPGTPCEGFSDRYAAGSIVKYIPSQVDSQMKELGRRVAGIIFRTLLNPSYPTDSTCVCPGETDPKLCLSDRQDYQGSSRHASSCYKDAFSQAVSSISCLHKGKLRLGEVLQIPIHGNGIVEGTGVNREPFDCLYNDQVCKDENRVKDPSPGGDGNSNPGTNPETNPSDDGKKETPTKAVNNGKVDSTSSPKSSTGWVIAVVCVVGVIALLAAVAFFTYQKKHKMGKIAVAEVPDSSYNRA